MVTDEHRKALKRVADSISLLNLDLDEAGRLGIHVELHNVSTIGRRNPRYLISVAEMREQVVPA